VNTTTDFTLEPSGILRHNHNGVHLDWCEHLKSIIETGADAPLLHPDMRIQVPIFPTAEVWVEVYIQKGFAHGSAAMSLEYTPDVGRPYSIELGFWNPGEGMASIRSVVLDYLRSKLSEIELFSPNTPIVTPCPAGGSVHSMKHSLIVSQKSQADLQWKLKCLWNIVMERACTPCLELTCGSDPLEGLGNL